MIRIRLNFTSYDCFHDNGSHSNGFDNTIIIQIHIVWRNCLIHVEFGPMWSHVFGGNSQIPIPFEHTLELCPITHYNCVIVIVFHIPYIFAVFIPYFVTKMCNKARPCAVARKWVASFALSQHDGGILTLGLLLALRHLVHHMFRHVVSIPIGIVYKAVTKYSYDARKLWNKIMMMFLSLTNTSKQASWSASAFTFHVVQQVITLMYLQGEVTTLSSWEPHANKKNLLFLSCITKMGQNFINLFCE